MGHRGRSRQWAGGPQDWQNHRGRGRGGWGGGPWGHGGPGGWEGPMGGPPPWLAGIFGFEQPGRRGRGGPRVRRGDVRAAILDVLHTAARGEEQLNGYQVIQQIAERSGGAWRPSPGSVYPTVQQLQDEGLVEADDERGRKTLRLSADGVRYAEENAEELAAVWRPFEDAEESTQSSAFADLKPEIGQVMSAVWQILTTGTDAQRRAAVDVLVDARRKLYGILADGPETEGPEAEGPDEVEER